MLCVRASVSMYMNNMCMFVRMLYVCACESIIMLYVYVAFKFVCVLVCARDIVVILFSCLSKE